MMHLSPDVFWNMSVNEIVMAINGFKEYNTGKKESNVDVDDIKDLMARYQDY